MIIRRVTPPGQRIYDERSAATFWRRGDADTLALQIARKEIGNDGEVATTPIALDANTIECEVCWHLVAYKLTPVPQAELNQNFVKLGIREFDLAFTDYRDHPTIPRSTLAVTVGADQSANPGRASFQIAEDFYPVNAPELVYGATRDIPAAELIFEWDRSATQSIGSRLFIIFRQMEKPDG